MSDNIRASAGFEILLPKPVQAIPVPCAEWDFIHSKVGDLTTEPWLFQTVGSLLIGAGVATFISIITGAVPSGSYSNAFVIAWAVTACGVLIGAACLFFAGQERKVYRQRAADLATQMTLIEKRYERAEV